MTGSIVVNTGTLPASRQWRGIAWNGSLFVVVASGGTDKAASSSDGLVWAERTLPSLDGWFGLAAGGSTFCAVSATSSAVATSTDGITWTPGTAPVAGTNPQIAWNGSLFCVVDTNNIMTSADGLSWSVTASPPVANVSWNDMIWDGSKFYAVGSVSGDSSNTHVISSADGTSWADEAITGTFGSGLAFKGTTVVATSSTIDANISEGGAAFFTTPLPIAGSAARLGGDGLGFLGMSSSGGDAVISANGIDWETHPLGLSRSWLWPVSNGTVYVNVGFNSTTAITVAVTYPALAPVDAFWTRRIRTQEII